MHEDPSSLNDEDQDPTSGELKNRITKPGKPKRKCERQEKVVDEIIYEDEAEDEPVEDEPENAE